MKTTCAYCNRDVSRWKQLDATRFIICDHCVQLLAGGILLWTTVDKKLERLYEKWKKSRRRQKRLENRNELGKFGSQGLEGV